MGYFVRDILDSRQNEDEFYMHIAHLPFPAPLMMVQFGRHRTPPGYAFGPNVRDHYLLHFVKSGRGRLRTHNDREYQIRGGQMFAIYPHQINWYEADKADPWRYFWVGFEGAWAAEVMEQLGFTEEDTVRQIPDQERVFAMLEEMYGRIKAGMEDNANTLAAIGMMYQLFSLCSRRGEEAGHAEYSAVPGQFAGEYTKVILSIIKTSYGEQLNVQELASRLNVNRSYLTQVFKKETGLSIKQYLIEYRLQEVKLRLADVGMSVKKAAYECGFTDPLYMSRLFTRKYGISPTAWKAQLMKEEGEKKERQEKTTE